MSFKYPETVLLALTLILAGSRGATADDCCDHCGTRGPCRRICRLVYEEQKVEVTCWGCKCEDFCLPCPSKPGCRHCEEVCGECDPIDPHAVYAKPKNFLWREWFPSSHAKMYTKKKLMKKTITKKVPGYKWVVEDLCQPCQTAQAERDANQPLLTEEQAPPAGAADGIVPAGYSVLADQAPQPR